LPAATARCAALSTVTSAPNSRARIEFTACFTNILPSLRFALASADSCIEKP
jgi:hypothetical protein